MIGKTIKSILTADSTLIALVPAIRIFPYVMNEGTTLPAIAYTIDGLQDIQYTKGGWSWDQWQFSVYSVSKDYAQLQTVVSAIRNALELSTAGYGTESIGNIYLNAFDEGWDQGAEAFYNKLQFTVKTNSY
jgi:hypothetical protein